MANQRQQQPQGGAEFNQQSGAGQSQQSGKGGMGRNKESQDTSRAPATEQDQDIQDEAE